MKILVSGATTTVSRLAKDNAEYLGHLVTPNNGNDLRMVLRSGLDWAVDNAAYSNPNPIGFWNLLVELWDEWVRFNPPNWIAVPDVVGDHSATLRSFDNHVAEWSAELGYCPWNLAFVLQNGATVETVPWDQITAVFVGGDDGFKIRGSSHLIDAARQRGKTVHIGRVNSLRRIQIASDLGADTVDGSGYSKYADTHLPRAITELKAISRQPSLFQFAA